jgi:hypothetical protein
MTKKILAAALFFILAFVGSIQLNAQNAITQEGEFGFGVGAGHYFGDLNTRARLNRAKMAATAFFRKNLGNYIAVRVAATFAQLGYSDQYNTHNLYMYQRNLSFNSKVWELALQGDFNFFRFMPGEPAYSFTPYITLGVGVFTYDPYAYLKGEKIMLRQLEVGTEGQGSSLYPDRKKYNSMAICIPFGGGFKYSLNEKINIGFEILHRFTNTDYLDDVSKTYVDPAAFPLNIDGSISNSQLLSDRSFELGDPIGRPGLERGQSRQKDQFITAMIHLTFNLQSYKCPTAK